MCSAHNVGGSKGQFLHMEQEEKERERDERDGGRVLRFSALDGIGSCKKKKKGVAVCGSASDNGRELATGHI